MSENPQWVAVYTRTRAEKIVSQRLVDQGIETYLPVRLEKHHWSDRVKMVSVPMFRSYLFVKMCRKTEMIVRETAGIVTIVKFGDKYSIVPESQIEMIRKLEQSASDLYVYETAHLKRGTRVLIQEGDFAGMEGTIVSNCKDGNFAVNVEALRMSVVVSLDRNVLEVARRSVSKKSKYDF